MQRKDKADRLPQSRRKRDSDQSFLPETPQNERGGTPVGVPAPGVKPSGSNVAKNRVGRGTEML